MLKKVARFVGSFDQFMTHTLGVYDAAGNKVLQLTGPATGDLRLFALAAAAGVDTALKQDDRGLSIG